MYILFKKGYGNVLDVNDNLDKEFLNESEKVEKEHSEESSFLEENVDDLNKEEKDKTEDHLQLSVSYEDEINMAFKNAVIRDNINNPFLVEGVGTFYSTKVS